MACEVDSYFGNCYAKFDFNWLYKRVAGCNNELSAFLSENRGTFGKEVGADGDKIFSAFYLLLTTFKDFPLSIRRKIYFFTLIKLFVLYLP